ncbi:MAG: glycosyltransferase [Myxococcota bacterium]
MKIAYLTGQYPKVSHTFIRREIQGLEARGHEILRLSVRPADSGIADPADRAERDRTETFFAFPRAQVALDFLRTAARQPLAIARELGGIARSALRPGPGVVQRIAYLVEATAFLARLRAASVEHVHVHFARNGVSVAQIMQRLGGPGFSMTVHGPDEFDDPRGFELASKVADSRFTVAISAYTGAQLRRWIALDDWQKIHVVRCTVDESFFEATPIGAGPERIFVCVGRLCAQKGQLLLLEAFARAAARDPRARLVLAGDGEMRPLIEARIAALGLGERVEITGWIAEAEVRRRLRGACCMVLASFAEGLPVVIMEALAMQRPVLSTYIAGIPELVDSETGWLVPSGDVEALAEGLAAVLAADPETLAAKGRRGAERVRERHFVASEVDRLDALFRAAIRSPDSGPGGSAAS